MATFHFWEVAMDVRSHLLVGKLERLERAEKDAARSKRLRIIILAINGFTAPAVAMSVGLSRRICQRGLARYNELGLTGLDDRRGHAPQSPLTPEQEVLVRQRIEAGSQPEDQICSLRGVDFQPIRASEFGVLRSLPGVYHLLRRLGDSYLRPRPRHRRATPQAREEFKSSLPARLQTLREAHPGRRLRAYFQDESRLGQQGTTTNLWPRRGSRPTAVRQTEDQ
ncbi:MAG: winged helix-turn-helix domain-containing protein [Planctomycetes bacterium]|nr:winged helix-turn-helix domain-containing protein [Planctomycetota bacterium]